MSQQYEFQKCNICGSVKLQYLSTNENKMICCICNNLDPRDKNIVNANLFRPSNNKLYPWDCRLDSQIPKSIITNLTPFAASAKPRLQYINQIEQVRIRAGQITTNNIKIDWSKIIGYNSIKSIIDRTLNPETQSKKRIHVLLCGSPGTSKTVFLLTIMDSLKKLGLNAHYLDSTTLSSSGVLEYMFTNDMDYCLLDELDKLKKEHQATFLNTLENGILQETKHNRIRRKEMKNCLFIVTANYQDKILKPLFTRMLTLLIPKYTREQFYAIGAQLLSEQYGKTKEIAYYITDQVWKIYTERRHEEPNLRVARDVAILTNNDKVVIDPILEGITTYSKGDIE